MLTQKLYFYDNDAICDVIMQESVRNGRHNNRHETRMDSLFELPVFYTNSTIFILERIDRGNFAVRGPTSFQEVLFDFINITYMHMYCILH